MYILLHNHQKMYAKLFTLAVFSIGLLATIHSKNEVMQKVARGGGSNKSVTRFRTFLDEIRSDQKFANFSVIFAFCLLS